MRKLSIFLLLLFLSPFAYAQTQTDFNKDGVSDITFIRVKTDGSLAWSYRNSKTKKKRVFSAIGQNGNHIALAKWKKNKPSLPGVVSLIGSSITWTVIDNGIPTSISHGVAGDLVVSGADVDGSGATDAIVVSIQNKVLIWKIRLDPFDGGPETVDEVSFGVDGDAPFFASADGVLDQLALFRQQGDGSQVFLYKHFLSGVESAGNLGSAVKDPLRPLPIRQASGPDILAVPTQDSSKTSFTLFHLSGKRIRKIGIKGVGDIVIGNFFSKERGEEIAVKNKSDFKLMNPFTRVTASVILNADIPIDEININSFGLWGSTNTGCVSGDPTDGFKRGFIWKPNSDTQFYGVVVLPHEFTQVTQSVTALTVDGQPINSFVSKGCANPDDQGPRCNWMATPYTGSRYRNEFGSIRLKVIKDNGECKTFDLNDPSKRID